MKNRLEAELISIAHRILKLKNKSEIDQLQQETLRLYEKLSVLKFVEENYGDPFVSVPDDVEDKIEHPAEEKEERKAESETIKEETKSIEETIPAQEKQAEIIAEAPQPIEEEKSTLPAEEEAPEESFSFDSRFEEFEARLANAKPNKAPSIFDEVTPVEEPVFVPAQTQQTEVKKTETTTIEITKSVSINDAVKKNFNIGLNDKIAFEFHLFGGKSEDFNRVLSQLNTFNTFAEAKDFIDNIVKPDYNNWISKDEYATRFLEIIESKF